MEQNDHDGPPDGVGVVARSIFEKAAILFGMIVVGGLVVVSGILHVRAYSSVFIPCVCGSGCKGGILAAILLFHLFYSLPVSLVARDGALSRFGGLLVTAALDGCLEFSVRDNSSSPTNLKWQRRIALRIIFLGSCVLAIYLASVWEASLVDYKGPMRVTEVSTLIESIETNSGTVLLNSYYPMLTVEWGHEWACKNSRDPTKWCTASVTLRDDSCSKEWCHDSRSQDGFANKPYETAANKDIAALEVATCMLAKQDKTIVPSEKVDRDTAPWLDPKNPDTMTFAGSCDSCTIIRDVKKNPHEDKARLRFGIALLLSTVFLVPCLPSRENDDTSLPRYAAVELKEQSSAPQEETEDDEDSDENVDDGDIDDSIQS